MAPSTQKPLSAEEVKRHPGYESTEWKLTPTKSGMCPVAEGRRGGPFNLWWEIHGTGDIKIVVSCDFIHLVVISIHVLGRVPDLWEYIHTNDMEILLRTQYHPSLSSAAAAAAPLYLGMCTSCSFRVY